MKILKSIFGILFILSTLSVLAQQAPPQASLDSSPQVIVPLSQTQVSDSALYFNGNLVVDISGYVDQPDYDFAFGPHISPHGDCLDFFGKYVFLTWYYGGEENRNVMLSRYNRETGMVATIKFDHRHTGFQNNPNIGESHNTIAVGISPLDSTIHLLYDMHAYSDTRPADGSLANDYFRYQYSAVGGAVVSDAEFTKSLFSPKQLFLKEGEDYKGLTYPEFFPNLNGELMVKMRRGGNSDGKFMFAKYNPTEGWSTWTDFNIQDASSSSEINYDWGLYGSFKYLAGKMRIGFSTRYNISDDKYIFNNGFHYAYSNDPTGKSEWFNAKGEPFDLPLINPDFIKISEPGDEVSSTAPNTVRISVDAEWSVNDREDIHFITRVGSTNVHTFKKSSDAEFSTSTEFPGGKLLGLGNNMYLVKLENGRPVIYRANGGTNDWIEVYRQESGTQYMFGIPRIHEDQLYYYLMEDRGSLTGDANPTDLLVYELNDLVPAVGFLNIANNEIIPKGTNLTVEAATNAPYNNLSLYINDALVSTLTDYPYSWSDQSLLTKLGEPSYILKLVATNGEGDSIAKEINITTAGQSAYTSDGLPHKVPGAVQFVDYDEGGLDIAYYDRSEQDLSKYTYRGDDRVDMNLDGTKVVFIQGAGDDVAEYVEYTINVTQTAFYDLNVTHNKARDGEFNQMTVSFPDEDTVLIETFTGRDAPTNSEFLTDLMGNVLLTEGDHILRFTMNSFGFNLEKFEFSKTHDAFRVTFNDGTNQTFSYSGPDGMVQFPDEPTLEEQVFVQWITGTGEVFDANTVVTADIEVFAQWEDLKYYMINITSENGTVSVNPDLSEFPMNSEAVLTATPNQDYKFVGWTGDITSSENPLTITIVDKDVNITAVFELKTYLIDIASENGLVSVDPDQSEFTINSEVILTAIPNIGYEFVEWSGDATSSENPLIIVMDKDFNIVAEFIESVVLSELNDTHGVKIYPNPSDEHIFIEGAPKGSIITLVGLDGSILKTLEIADKKVKLDITSLDNGQYILLIQESVEKNYFKKIIIE